MIALFRKCGGADFFPVQVISERWFIKSSDIDLPPFQLLMLDETVEIQSILSERSSGHDPDSDREENGNGIIGSASASEEKAEAENIEETSRSDDETEADISCPSTGRHSEDQHQRFCRLMATAKEIAGKATTAKE
jgi:hypothetical protein